MMHGTYRRQNYNQDYNTDYMTDAGRVITNNMAAIHQGDCFSSHMALDSLIYGVPYDVLIETPADKYMHIKFIDTFLANVGSAACLQIWEDIESYAGGWLVDIHNRRRPSVPATTLPPTTTLAPTTTKHPTTTSTTTTTTQHPRTTTTKGPTTTTEAPHIYSPYSDLDLRLTWSEEERFYYTAAEAALPVRVQDNPPTTNAIIREGGVAVLGPNAIEIDAYRYLGFLRVTADRWFDHEWIFRKDKLYLIRVWRIAPVPVTTTPVPVTTNAPTTTSSTTKQPI
jgi:hypothetical protein